MRYVTIQVRIVFLYVCSSLYKKRNFNYIFVYMRRFRSIVSLRITRQTDVLDPHNKISQKLFVSAIFVAHCVCWDETQRSDGEKFQCFVVKDNRRTYKLFYFRCYVILVFHRFPLFWLLDIRDTIGERGWTGGGTGYIVSCRTVYLLTEPQSIFRKSQRLSPSSV